MYQTTVDWDKTISGTHMVFPEVSAWYDGKCTVPNLPVIDGKVVQHLGENGVLTKLSITIANPDGDLTPRVDTDPLSPMGQQLFVRIAVGSTQKRFSIPVGWFRIDKAEPVGGWFNLDYFHPASRSYKEVWRPSSEPISLECSDLTGYIVQDSLSALMSPRKGATVADEVVRMVGGRMKVDKSTFPITPVDSSVVYEDKPIVNIDRLLRLGGMVARCNRNGALEAVIPRPTSTPVAFVRAKENLETIKFAPSREGLVNAVITLGDGGWGQTNVYGYAAETTGPLRVNGPLGRIPRFHSSPWYNTTNAADKGANTMLNNIIAKRDATVDVTMAFNPAIEVPDTIRMTMHPDSENPFEVDGMITDLEYSLNGGSMSASVSIKRKDVGQWMMP